MFRRNMESNLAFILEHILVTIAGREKAFSKLSVIKRFSRASMLQVRLNGLALLSIELKTKLDY